MNKFFLIILPLYQTSFAEDFSSLDTITVTSNSNFFSSEISSDEIKKGLAADEKDLLRNTTGVVVTEGGRSGFNGFAIRGVDSERISIAIDGVKASESYMPKFYYQKGFHNGNSNSIETENISYVDLTKGSNSVSEGSGAIGGSVVMRTKTADDFVQGEKPIGLYSKFGYNSKNSQFTKVLGAGLKHNSIEGVFQYTKRNGEETKNYHSGKIKDISICGRQPDNQEETIMFDPRERYPELCGFGRILPDVVSTNSDSVLLKAGYRISDEHFINTFYESTDKNYNTEEKSNSITMSRKNTEDNAFYKRLGLSYEYTPQNNSYVSYWKSQLTQQNATQRARSFQYGMDGRYAGYPDWDATWNKVEFIRKNDVIQKSIQFDNNITFSDFGLWETNHSISSGIGIHKKELKTRNTEEVFSYNNYTPPKTQKKTEHFAIQQPVQSTVMYLFVEDSIDINDKINMNIGARLDRYEYNPKVSTLPYENSIHIVNKAQAKSFSAISYKGGFDYAITDKTVLSYGISTGFKAPKVDEMYFEMNGASANKYVNNINLKPEKSLTHEIGIKTQSNNISINANAFYTKYSNFIDTSYKADIESYKTWSGVTKYRLKSTDFQNVNIDSASVYGVELNTKINGPLFNLPESIYTTFKASYAKGSKSDDTSLLAISPLTAIVGIGYEDDNLDILLSARMVAAKKANDSLYKSSAIDFSRDTGKITDNKIEPFPFRSHGYAMFDLTASYNISKNISIYGGIFNIFNKKSSTWENLRQLKNNGNQSWIRNSGFGIERYTEPGRNFSLSIEARL